MEHWPVLFNTKTNLPKQITWLIESDEDEPDQKPTFIDPAIEDVDEEAES